MTMHDEAATHVEREILWFSAVIRNAASVARRKYRRWNRDVPILNQPNSDDGEEYVHTIANAAADLEYATKELAIWFESLPAMQAAVLHNLFIDGYSQKTAAVRLHISQQHVSRLKQHALAELRKGLVEK